jgi:hypothetical protein
MATRPAAPIVVNGQSLPAVLAAALRYLIATGGTFAVARGWVDPENIEGIATMLITVATVAYGLYRTRKKQQQLVVAADAAPNSVARVES